MGQRHPRKCSGVSGEWHLVFTKAFQEITFGLVPWFHEAIIWFGSAFLAPRLIPIRAIRDTMAGDGIQQLLVEGHARCRVVLTLESNHGLESFEGLDRALEADRTRFDAM